MNFKIFRVFICGNLATGLADEFYWQAKARRMNKTLPAFKIIYKGNVS